MLDPISYITNGFKLLFLRMLVHPNKIKHRGVVKAPKCIKLCISHVNKNRSNVF